MKQKIKNFLKKIIPATLIIVFCTLGTAFASGEAVYRSGGWGNDYEHAGVYDGNGKVYEINGPFTHVTYDDWSTFLAGKTYWGAYINPSMSSYDRTRILNTAAALASNTAITYTGLYMIDTIVGAGAYITTDEITDIRCDGVVEYSYEWNNIWVWGRSSDGTQYGYPTHFDVSDTRYTYEHNLNLGKDQPWIQTSPYIQRGAAGQNWTQLRPQ